MIIRERLLERISRLEDDNEEKKQQKSSSTTWESESIQLHLARLLNTRQGSVSIAPDYGVPDMTNVPGDSVQEIRQNIEQILQKVVRKYEPRLINTRLVMQETSKQSFDLQFRLEAVVAGHEDVSITFETVVTTDGRIGIT